MTLSRRQFLRKAAQGLGAAALFPLAGQLAIGKPSRAIGGGRLDADTLIGKVLCGYQGWFRCPGDSAGVGWRHWSRNAAYITPDTLTVDMWPDLSDYSDDELYPADDFTTPDGEQAYLFSSAHPLTVNRHFDWMQDHGLDGVLLQRFVTGLIGPPNDTRVLSSVRDAANRTGRVFALEYDMSGTPTDQVLDRMVNDWTWLVDQTALTDDPAYLHHEGMPVLAIWGFFTSRFDGALAQQIIDYFTNDPDYGVFLIGGCQWWWRSETDPDWMRAFRRFGAISPWNVGNVSVQGGVKHAATGYWAQDLVEATNSGMLYLPVVYPGFSWDNLQHLPPGTSLIPRRDGGFLWEQFQTVAQLGNPLAKVAMFDEVDEGTAIFKVTNDPPPQGYFVTYDDLPSDYYLWLTGEGTQLIRGSASGRRSAAGVTRQRGLKV
jgi:hypothetical protein